MSVKDLLRIDMSPNFTVVKGGTPHSAIHSVYGLPAFH